MKTKLLSTQAGLFALAIAGCLVLGMTDGRAQLDFGDAPDAPYPTLLPTGARHTITALKLGAAIDAEANGQPNLPATGDDMAPGFPTPDDEDGVFLTSPLVRGSTATVTVISSGTGLLNAWMDFDDDGSWLTAGDQIFTDAPLVAGANFLTFPVPAGVLPIGRVYSRWRLNTAGGLMPSGAAADGEVEDYCHSPIHGQKWHDLNGDGKRDFTTEPGLNGQVIELYDELGTTLIASATTHDFEHTGNPSAIDPFYERGLYWMHAPAGFCILREKPNPSFAQTFPANCGAQEYFIHVQCEQLGREPKPPDCGPGPDWVELCPGPDIDEMFSAAQIIIEQPTGPNLTMFASGPTFVTRSAPMNAPGPNAFMMTEMVEMNLVGHHPATGRFHARAGTQVLPPLSPASQGQILENGGDQFVVDSFFDVFFEIEIPGFALQMRNDWNDPLSAHVETKITQVPPIGEEYVEEEIPLFLPAPFPGPTGPPAIGFKIIKLIHKPIHGLDFGNATVPPTLSSSDSVAKAALERKIKSLKKKIKKARKRGQRAKARRLSKQLRKLKKRLRALC